MLLCLADLSDTFKIRDGHRGSCLCFNEMQEGSPFTDDIKGPFHCILHSCGRTIVAIVDFYFVCRS